MKILKTSLLFVTLTSLLALTSGCEIPVLEEAAAEEAAPAPTPYVSIRNRGGDTGGGWGG